MALLHSSAGSQPAGYAYNARATSFVVTSCMTAAMGGVIYGYDIGIAGGVSSMEPFLKKFFPEVYAKMQEDSRVSNYCKFDSQLLTAFTSSFYIAGLVATLLASSVTRRFGRKPAMLVAGATFLAGAALGGAAVDVYMLILGRLLLGVGVGFGNQSIPLYLSEMAPPQYRGAFNNGFQFSISVGFIIASLVNFGTEKIHGGWGWRLSLALATVPASFLTLGALFLPETPNSLIERGGDVQEAKHLLQKIRGAVDVDGELHDLITASAVAKDMEDHPFRRIVRRKYRPQLVMAIAIPFFQQVTGINVIAFYAPILFRTIGLGESASLMSAVVTGLVSTSCTLVSMAVVDRVGRRALFLVGGVQMFAAQVVIGGIVASQLGDQGGLSKGYAYFLLVMIAVYVAAYGWSWGPLGFLIPSETYQLEIRSAGQSITVAVSFLFTFVIAQVFLTMLCHMRSGIFFFFAVWLVAMTLFVHLLLPETKNVPIEQTSELWKGHLFWKKIVGSQVLDEELS